MALDSDNKWIRPVSKLEMFLEVAHQRGFMLSSYCTTLNSVQPLQENTVKAALIHLARKIPTLRVCIRPKENETWFYEMVPESVDFQVRDYEKLDEEYVGMTKHRYDVFNGPLWCARWFSVPATEPCPMAEVKAEYPYQYQLILGFHHIITDGTSSMKICGFFLGLLNDVIEGREINDEEQLAYHESGEQNEKLVNDTIQHLMTNPSELEKYKKFTSGADVPPFLKAYPPPNDTYSQTLNLVYDFGKDDTSKLVKICKAKGVSFHSAFCTAANTAIIEMLQDKGIIQEEYEIQSAHVSNNRRYWDGDVTKAFGPYIGLFTVVSKCSRNIAEEFWNHAQQFNSGLQVIHQETVPYKELCARFISMPAEADSDNLQNNFMHSTCYTTTNMGNVSGSFSGEGKNVQATSIKRTTSSTNQVFAHVLQTFRGRLLYGLDYDPSLVTKETAQLYLNKVFNILRYAIGTS